MQLHCVTSQKTIIFNYNSISVKYVLMFQLQSSLQLSENSGTFHSSFCTIPHMHSYTVKPDNNRVPKDLNILLFYTGFDFMQITASREIYCTDRLHCWDIIYTSSPFKIKFYLQTVNNLMNLFTKKLITDCNNVPDSELYVRYSSIFVCMYLYFYMKINYMSTLLYLDNYLLV
jgi:hypothetical protein